MDRSSCAGDLRLLSLPAVHLGPNPTWAPSFSCSLFCVMARAVNPHIFLICAVNLKYISRLRHLLSTSQKYSNMSSPPSTTNQQQSGRKLSFGAGNDGKGGAYFNGLEKKRRGSQSQVSSSLNSMQMLISRPMQLRTCSARTPSRTLGPTSSSEN